MEPQVWQEQDDSPSSEQVPCLAAFRIKLLRIKGNAGRHLPPNQLQRVHTPDSDFACQDEASSGK